MTTQYVRSQEEIDKRNRLKAEKPHVYEKVMKFDEKMKRAGAGLREKRKKTRDFSLAKEYLETRDYSGSRPDAQGGENRG